MNVRIVTVRDSPFDIGAGWIARECGLPAVELPLNLCQGLLWLGYAYGEDADTLFRYADLRDIPATAVVRATTPDDVVRWLEKRCRPEGNCLRLAIAGKLDSHTTRDGVSNFLRELFQQLKEEKTNGENNAQEDGIGRSFPADAVPGRAW